MYIIYVYNNIKCIYKLTRSTFISARLGILNIPVPLLMNKIDDHSVKGWFTLTTESEAESESEAQGALRSSVNQKEESEAESEARRNRSQKDRKSLFFFRSRFLRLRSSENKVNGIVSGSGVISQSNNSLPVPFKLRARKNGGSIPTPLPSLPSLV